MSIATMDDVSMFRDVPGEAEERMELFLALANEWAEGEIGCDLTAGTAVVEYLSGDGTRILSPHRWPINEVDSITIALLGLTLTVLKDGGTDTYQDVFQPAHGFYLILREPHESTYGLAGWPSGIGNIKVTYDCGYSTMPADLRGMVGMLTHLLWSKREIIGRSALPSGQRDSLSPVVKALDEYPLIASTLRRYRRSCIG